MPRRFIAPLAGGIFCVAISFAAQAQQRPPQFQSAPLPDGDGKALVESVCTGCHQTNQITRSSGYITQEWDELIATMIDLSGSPEQKQEIIQYLTENFPPNSHRASHLIPGDAKITFKEWQVPTLGQRARDPIEAPDGSIWWVGQFGNIIGKINPATGEMTEYPLPPNSLPHSVTFDADGNPWYTGNANGTVGKIDPETGEATVYKMPDPAARDPHTAIFDEDGIMWFTLQGSNMIGRLDPESGDIRLVTLPRAGSRPYGIKIDEDGNPWVACNGNNCLIKVDPETMALSEVLLPEGSTVRRLFIADDGLIWYVNSSLGRLGRYNPDTGEIEEWPSPSGPDSHPYAIAVVDGIVWYNESGKRPDALVRFDPATETFQSWAIPSGGVYAGIVRRMMPTRDGHKLLIHQSSTNRIILVTPQPSALTQ